MLKFNIKTLTRWKVHIDRSKSYIGYVQFAMVGIIFAKSMLEDIKIWLYPLLLLSIIFIMVIVGYLENKIGIKSEEQINLCESNPLFMELLNNVKTLTKEVKGERRILRCKNPAPKY